MRRRWRIISRGAVAIIGLWGIGICRARWRRRWGRGCRGGWRESTIFRGLMLLTVWREELDRGWEHILFRLSGMTITKVLFLILWCGRIRQEKLSCKIIMCC